MAGLFYVQGNNRTVSDILLNKLLKNIPTFTPFYWTFLPIYNQKFNVYFDKNCTFSIVGKRTRDNLKRHASRETVFRQMLEMIFFYATIKISLENHLKEKKEGDAAGF